MGKQELQARINKNLRDYFKPLKRRVNAVYFNSGNTYAHEIMKAVVCLSAQAQGFTYICEGELLNGRRPDITILDTPEPLCIEIVQSESKESIMNKEPDYPGRIIVMDLGSDDRIADLVDELMGRVRL